MRASAVSNCKPWMRAAATSCLSAGSGWNSPGRAYASMAVAWSNSIVCSLRALMEREIHSDKGQARTISRRATKRAISKVEMGEIQRCVAGSVSNFVQFGPSAFEPSAAQIQTWVSRRTFIDSFPIHWRHSWRRAAHRMGVRP